MYVRNTSKADRRFLYQYDDELAKLEYKDDHVEMRLSMGQIKLLESTGRISHDVTQGRIGSFFMKRWKSTDPEYPNIEIYERSYRK